MSAKNVANYVTLIAFLTLLAIPGILTVTGHAGADVPFIERTERRHAFVAPMVSSGALVTGGWERDLDRQVADQFPMRTAIIRAYNRLQFRVFNELHSDQVIQGRGGWYFLDERKYITGAIGNAELSHVADVYASRARWCRRRNIAYALVFAPNKSTIYPEFLPAGLAVALPSPLDRLLPILRKRGVFTIDVRPALKAARGTGEMYSLGDTHWNAAGAYIGYTAIANALKSRAIHVDAIDPATIHASIQIEDADLYRLAGIEDVLQNRWVAYDFPNSSHEIPSASIGDKGELAEIPVSATESSASGATRLVVFGDSFSGGLAPYLSASLRHVVFIRPRVGEYSEFTPKTLEIEKPTVVLDELVERNIGEGAQLSVLPPKS